VLGCNLTAEACDAVPQVQGEVGVAAAGSTPVTRVNHRSHMGQQVPYYTCAHRNHTHQMTGMVLHMYICMQVVTHH
jgi:hypothetical protein